MEGFILLNDVIGEERGGIISAATNLLAEGKLSKQRNIIRGELLYPIHDNTPQKGGKPPHNYRLAGEKTTTLYADMQDTSPLSQGEFEILEGIKKPYDRYKVFSAEGWLEWGTSLRAGSVAFVAVEGIGGRPITTEVVVQFLGKIGDEPGVKFGVEIMVRLVTLQYIMYFYIPLLQESAALRCGTTDGTFKGRRYFTCTDNCGLFLGLDKLLSSKKIDYPKPTYPKASVTSCMCMFNCILVINGGGSILLLHAMICTTRLNYDVHCIHHQIS